MRLLLVIILPVFTLFNISCTHPHGDAAANVIHSQKRTSFITYRDVRYGLTDSIQQSMDVFLPAEADRATTGVVIVIHGGSWTSGEKNDFNGLGLDTFLCANDLAMVNINYRLAGQYPYPACLDDIGLVMDLIRTNADEWHINPDKVCLLGRSSGAHLALLYAYTRNTGNRIKVVTDLFGPADLTAGNVQNGVLNSSIVTWLGRFATNQLAWRDASPLFHMNGAIPTIIMHGTTDSVVYTSQSIILEDSLLAHGIPCTYIPWDGNGHGWNQGRWNENRDVAMALMKRFLKD